MPKADNKTKSPWVYEIKEKMAGTLLAKIVPASGVGVFIAFVVQLIVGDPIIKLLPTLTALLFLIISFLFFRQGRNLFAMHIIIVNYIIGLLALVIIGRSFGYYSGLIVASILICWVCWFTPRIFSAIFLIILQASFVFITFLNVKGVITEIPTVSYIPILLTAPFGMFIIYLSIITPQQLLTQTNLKSLQSEALANHALESLKQNRSFTMQAVDHSRQYFGWLTSDGILQYCNSISLEAIGKTSAEVVGKPFWENPWFSSDEAEATRLRESIEKVKEGKDIAYTFYSDAPKAGPRKIDFSLHPIFDSNEDVTMIVAEGRDITTEREAIEQKEKLREQLHQVQKMDAVGQLAGGIAHDINNTLSGIIGGAELLLSDDLTDDMRNEYINIILNSAERAGELTRKLLAFSRKGTKAIRPIDINNIVEDTVTILRRTLDKKISVSIEKRAGNTVVSGDDALLQNVLLNLGINAGHAMPDGGSLTFTIDNTVLDDDYCHYSPFDISEGEFLQLSVNDTGCGMSPEVQSHIFEPFFTTKEPGKGTGLGLSAAYGTIQDHHGAITVYSEPDNGTIFRIYLPLSKPVVPIVSEMEMQKGSGTILVIDDEEMIRVTTSAILTRLGYTVLLAENGEVGLTIFHEQRQKIGIVILDMIMPIMSGREVFQKIHSKDPDLPIIIASGYARPEDSTTLHEQGVSAFLLKPFRRTELATQVAKFIRR